MLGRCSLFLYFERHDPEIECTLSKIRAKKHDFKKKMAQEQTPPHKQLKEYFTNPNAPVLLWARV